jgi:hypothetical protein
VVNEVGLQRMDPLVDADSDGKTDLEVCNSHMDLNNHKDFYFHRYGDMGLVGK